MFQRVKHRIVHGNVKDFHKKGVGFCIHVYYNDGGREEVMALGPPLQGGRLLGVSASSHPDQLYLDSRECAQALRQLTGKTVTKVEVDDSIIFCGTGPGQCGQVVPDWIRGHFPDAEAYLFVLPTSICAPARK